MAAAKGPLVEICVEGIDGYLAAVDGGADRVELCAALIEGGITPSLATVRSALRLGSVPFRVMIRPRGGDFLYSPTEFDSMVDDVAAFAELGVDGVVAGCLTADGRIDEARMRALVDAAGNAGVTCHRAFDMTRDPFEALDALVRAGVDRVLTSGQRDTALEGLDVLTALVRHAGDRIVVMGCGGLDAGNVARVACSAGLAEIHFAALTDLPSGMIFRNPHVGMGGSDIDREYRVTVTDPAAVAATIAAAKAG